VPAADPRYDLPHARGNLGAARVAVLDTGLSSVVPVDALFDFSGTGVRANVTHGTRMVQTLRAVAPAARVWYYKVIDGYKDVTGDAYGHMAAAVAHAVASDVQAISISVAGYTGGAVDSRLQSAVAAALAKGVGVFAAAGDARTPTAPMPAGLAGVCRCAWDQLILPWSTACWPTGNGMSSDATAAICGAYCLWGNCNGNFGRVANPFAYWRDGDLPRTRRNGVPYCGDL